MKQYKIGDTIYIKDTVNNIDEHDPIGTYRGKYTGWFANRTIIDELLPAEPVKPVLPEDVADEIQQAKDMRLNFYMYIITFSNDSATRDFAFHNCLADVSDEQFKILSDAWYNGYTVEKEPVYNLILGFDPDESDRRLCNALYKNHGELSIDAATDTYDLRGDDDYQFTQEEIDKYNKNFWIKNIDLNDYKVEVEE